MYRTITTNVNVDVDVDVDVDLDEFDIEDIIEYLEDNGYRVEGNASDEGISVSDKLAIITETLNIIYQKQRTNQEFNRELESLIYSVTGRISN